MSTHEKGPLQLLYERLYVVVIVTAAAVAAAWYVSGELTPLYRSQARCFMPTRADMLSLTTEEGNLPEGPKLPTGLTEAQDSLLGVLRASDLRQTVAAAVEGRSSAQLADSVDFAIDKYNLITITALDPDPAVAQRVAQEYLRAFRAKLDETTKAGIRDGAEVLDGAIAGTLRQIEALELERREFLRGQGTVDFGTEFALVADQVKSYSQKVNDLDARLEGLEKGRAELAGQVALLPPADPESFVPRARSEVPNPVLQDLEDAVRAAELELQKRLALYEEGHRVVQEQREYLEFLRDELAAEQERVDATLQLGPHPLREALEAQLIARDLEIAGAKAERAKYAELLAAAQAEFQRLPEYELKLEDFASELANLKTMLSNQRSRAAELDLYLKRNTSFLATAEDPALPTEPWFPQVPLILAAAGLLGFVLSVAIAVAMARAAQFRQEALW